MTCVPYFLTELQAINTSPSCDCVKYHDPNCMMSSVCISPSRRSPRCPPLPPLEANTHVAEAVPSPWTNLSGGLNAEVHNFFDAILLSHKEIGAGDGANVLREGGTADEINSTPHPPNYCFQLSRRGGADDNQEGIQLSQCGTYSTELLFQPKS